MDLLGELERIHHPISRLTFLNEQGREKFSVSYAAFRALFDGRTSISCEGISNGVLYAKTQGRLQIRFGAKVESFDQDARGVRVSLVVRATVRADLLVGADGVHSLVRHLAFGRSSRSPVTWDAMRRRSSFAIRRHVSRSPMCSIAWPWPGGQVSVYPVRGGG